MFYIYSGSGTERKTISRSAFVLAPIIVVACSSITSFSPTPDMNFNQRPPIYLSDALTILIISFLLTYGLAGLSLSCI